MSYKSTILTSLLIFSSSFIAPVFGMETKNNVQSEKTTKRISQVQRTVPRKTMVQTQQPDNIVSKGVVVIKSLKTSLDKLQAPKLKQKQQQQKTQQKAPQQSQKQELQQQSQQQQQQKLLQQKTQQQRTQLQQRQQKMSQQLQQQKQTTQSQSQQQQKTLQQKENINKVYNANNVIQGEQPKKPRPPHNLSHKNNQTVQTAATLLAVASNVIQGEQPKKPRQRNRNRNKTQIIQEAATIFATNMVLQNERGKKTERQDDNKGQNVQPVVKKEQKKPQKAQLEITRSKSRVRIYNPSCGKEIIVFKDPKYILLPGAYYRTQKGLMPVPKNLKSHDGLPVVKNHLSQLTPFDNTVLTKRDCLHNFPKCVEKECGEWARVVIRNDKDDPQQILDSANRFTMYATVRGQINKIEFDSIAQKPIITEQLPGVFEFKVRKSLYEETGQCLHRFLAPKGMVGAEKFGAKAQNKRIGL